MAEPSIAPENASLRDELHAMLREVVNGQLWAWEDVLDAFEHYVIEQTKAANTLGYARGYDDGHDEFCEDQQDGMCLRNYEHTPRFRGGDDRG